MDPWQFAYLGSACCMNSPAHTLRSLPRKTLTLLHCLAREIYSRGYPEHRENAEFSSVSTPLNMAARDNTFFS